MSKLGEFIREKRLDKDISLRKLAEISGISFSHLSKIERGEHNPAKETLETLSKALDIDLYELLLMAGYSSDADEIFWRNLFENIHHNYNEINEKYYKNGKPDIMSFRNDFVHGMIDDKLSEQVSAYFFNAASKSNRNPYQTRKTNIVSEVREELGDQYGEWFDLIDQLIELKYRPEDVKNRINFFSDFYEKSREIAKMKP